MLSCKDVTEVCSAEMERPLQLREELSMHLHLMICAGCTQYRRQLGTVREAMRAYAEGRGVSEMPDDGAPE